MLQRDVLSSVTLLHLSKLESNCLEGTPRMNGKKNKFCLHLYAFKCEGTPLRYTKLNLDLHCCT